MGKEIRRETRKVKKFFETLVLTKIENPVRRLDGVLAEYELTYENQLIDFPLNKVNIVESNHTHLQESDIDWDYGLFEQFRPRPTVVCMFCHQETDAETAHLHQGEWICDENCWEERLRSSE